MRSRVRVGGGSSPFALIAGHWHEHRRSRHLLLPLLTVPRPTDFPLPLCRSLVQLDQADLGRASNARGSRAACGAHDRRRHAHHWWVRRMEAHRRRGRSPKRRLQPRTPTLPLAPSPRPFTSPLPLALPRPAPRPAPPSHAPFQSRTSPPPCPRASDVTLARGAPLRSCTRWTVPTREPWREPRAETKRKRRATTRPTRRTTTRTSEQEVGQRAPACSPRLRRQHPSTATLTFECGDRAEQLDLDTGGAHGGFCRKFSGEPREAAAAAADRTVPANLPGFFVQFCRLAHPPSCVHTHTDTSEGEEPTHPTTRQRCASVAWSTWHGSSSAVGGLWSGTIYLCRAVRVPA